MTMENEKITLYRVNIYESYSASEKGVVWMKRVPNDTIYYKYEVLEVRDFELPKGVKESDIFYIGGHNEVNLVTKDDRLFLLQ